jgi:cytochrome c5
MSNADDHNTDHDSPHEGPIKTPKQLILAVFFAFVVPIIGIILLASYVATDKKSAPGSEGLQAKAVEQRIRPVAGAPDIKDLADPSTLRAGEKVYNEQCAQCHATGQLNSPKFGDAGQWAPRIARGYDELLASAIKGKGSMGAQGSPDNSDPALNFEVARAVVYMANKSGGKFGEPKLAAPAASAAQ